MTDDTRGLLVCCRMVLSENRDKRCVIVCLFVLFNDTTTTQLYFVPGARCSSVVKAFAHGAMGRWIYPS